MSERVKQAIDYCKKNNQGHLIDYLKPIFSPKADSLAKQIIKSDFPGINALYEDLYKNLGNVIERDILTPMKSTDISLLNSDKTNYLIEEGLKSIRNGEVAVITMAGGQGTRLGHNGPKGTFMLETNPPKSLFEIQCGQLLALKEKTGFAIPWLIMTSEENNSATIEFFQKNKFFGYDSEKIHFFQQDMLPIIDFGGKILVNEDGIANGPNGNGGIFSSLKKSGNYEWLKTQGVKRVFVCGIDNALVKVADPIFIGFSIESSKLISSKSALKRSFDEKAGVFCYKDGKPSYVEYTEISHKDAKDRGVNGEYLYGDIGIVMYVFNMDILDEIAETPLPYHIAKKKTPYLLHTGEKIDPEQPNSIKFEAFIFDSFDRVPDIALLRVKREEEFAPIKNKEGEDSPMTALEMFLKERN